jgi:hypothetical protein
MDRGRRGDGVRDSPELRDQFAGSDPVDEGAGSGRLVASTVAAAPDFSFLQTVHMEAVSRNLHRVSTLHKVAFRQSANSRYVAYRKVDRNISMLWAASSKLITILLPSIASAV